MNVRKGCWFAVSVLALGAAALHAPAKAAASDAVFAPSSVWNSPLPPSPVLDAKSSTWSSVLAGGAHVADIYEFGVPIYEPSAGTPRYAVRILNSPAWGPDPLAGDTVPLTSVYTPSVGSDGAMAVVDRSTGKSYDMWRFSWNGGRPQTAWAGVASLTGPGNDSDATGAGISRLAGVVRAGEIAAGAINHTLVFSSDTSCRGGYRYPATKTDGASSNSDCLPEGARVQLDPSIDVDALPGLSRGEKAVARALQTYGAVNIDNGGARMAVIFETPTDEADPYPAAGMTSDYTNLSGIPWSRLRVLRSADGS